jgi:hypothetical protein
MMRGRRQERQEEQKRQFDGILMAEHARPEIQCNTNLLLVKAISNAKVYYQYVLRSVDIMNIRKHGRCVSRNGLYFCGCQFVAPAHLFYTHSLTHSLTHSHIHIHIVREGKR